MPTTIPSISPHLSSIIQPCNSSRAPTRKEAKRPNGVQTLDYSTRNLIDAMRYVPSLEDFYYKSMSGFILTTAGKSVPHYIKTHGSSDVGNIHSNDNITIVTTSITDLSFQCYPSGTETTFHLRNEDALLQGNAKRSKYPHVKGNKKDCLNEAHHHNIKSDNDDDDCRLPSAVFEAKVSFECDCIERCNGQPLNIRDAATRYASRLYKGISSCAARYRCWPTKSSVTSGIKDKPTSTNNASSSHSFLSDALHIENIIGLTTKMDNSTGDACSSLVYDSAGYHSKEELGVTTLLACAAMCSHATLSIKLCNRQSHGHQRDTSSSPATPNNKIHNNDTNILTVVCLKTGRHRTYGRWLERSCGHEELRGNSKASYISHGGASSASRGLELPSGTPTPRLHTTTSSTPDIVIRVELVGILSVSAVRRNLFLRQNTNDASSSYSSIVPFFSESAMRKRLLGLLMDIKVSSLVASDEMRSNMSIHRHHTKTDVDEKCDTVHKSSLVSRPVSCLHGHNEPLITPIDLSVSHKNHGNNNKEELILKSKSLFIIRGFSFGCVVNKGRCSSSVNISTAEGNSSIYFVISNIMCSTFSNIVECCYPYLRNKLRTCISTKQDSNNLSDDRSLYCSNSGMIFRRQKIKQNSISSTSSTTVQPDHPSTIPTDTHVSTTVVYYELPHPSNENDRNAAVPIHENSFPPLSLYLLLPCDSISDPPPPVSSSGICIAPVPPLLQLTVLNYRKTLLKHHNDFTKRKGSLGLDNKGMIAMARSSLSDLSEDRNGYDVMMKDHTQNTSKRSLYKDGRCKAAVVNKVLQLHRNNKARMQASSKRTRSVSSGTVGTSEYDTSKLPHIGVQTCDTQRSNDAEETNDSYGNTDDDSNPSHPPLWNTRGTAVYIPIIVCIHPSAINIDEALLQPSSGISNVSSTATAIKTSKTYPEEADNGHLDPAIITIDCDTQTSDKQHRTPKTPRGGSGSVMRITPGDTRHFVESLFTPSMLGWRLPAAYYAGRMTGDTARDIRPAIPHNNSAVLSDLISDSPMENSNATMIDFGIDYNKIIPCVPTVTDQITATLETCTTTSKSAPNTPDISLTSTMNSIEPDTSQSTEGVRLSYKPSPPASVAAVSSPHGSSVLSTFMTHQNRNLWYGVNQQEYYWRGKRTSKYHSGNTETTGHSIIGDPYTNSSYNHQGSLSQNTSADAAVTLRERSFCGGKPVFSPNPIIPKDTETTHSTFRSGNTSISSSPFSHYNNVNISENNANSKINGSNISDLTAIPAQEFKVVYPMRSKSTILGQISCDGSRLVSDSPSVGSKRARDEVWNRDLSSHNGDNNSYSTLAVSQESNTTVISDVHGHGHPMQGSSNNRQSSSVQPLSVKDPIAASNIIRSFRRLTDTVGSGITATRSTHEGPLIQEDIIHRPWYIPYCPTSKYMFDAAGGTYNATKGSPCLKDILLEMEGISSVTCTASDDSKKLKREDFMSTISSNTATGIHTCNDINKDKKSCHVIGQWDNKFILVAIVEQQQLRSTSDKEHGAAFPHITASKGQKTGNGNITPPLLKSTINGVSTSNVTTVSGDTTIIAIDQHAVHERIRLEYFLPRMTDYCYFSWCKDATQYCSRTSSTGMPVDTCMYSGSTATSRAFHTTSLSASLVIPPEHRELIEKSRQGLEYWGWRFTEASVHCDNNSSLSSFSNTSSTFHHSQRKPRSQLIAIAHPVITIEGYHYTIEQYQHLYSAAMDLSGTAGIGNSTYNNIPATNRNTQSSKGKDEINSHPSRGQLYPIPLCISRAAVTRSCRGAIMFGMPLNREECQEIVQCIPYLLQYTVCSHGRVSMKPLVDVAL